ncbi:hypothetical protein [Streptomyces iranensis]|uniref:hypothetical protein n=1 Tax=Streptomyces iranensis TaxID=576784 RepID=UPI0039B734BC
MFEERLARWEARTDFRALLGMTFLGPGQPSPLLDVSYLSEAELADPEMRVGLPLGVRDYDALRDGEFTVGPDEPTIMVLRFQG